MLGGGGVHVPMAQLCTWEAGQLCGQSVCLFFCRISEALRRYQFTNQQPQSRACRSHYAHHVCARNSILGCVGVVIGLCSFVRYTMSLVQRPMNEQVHQLSRSPKQPFILCQDRRSKEHKGTGGPTSQPATPPIACIMTTVSMFAKFDSELHHSKVVSDSIKHS